MRAYKSLRMKSMNEPLQRKTKEILTCLTQWKWLRIDGEVKALLRLPSASSNDLVDFCKAFLTSSGRCFANGFDLNLVQIIGLQKLIKAVQECHDYLLVDTTYVNSGNLQVLKSLYHILHKVLSLDHCLGLILSEQLHKELNNHARCNLSGNDLPKDMTAVLQNAYLLLWNRAQTLDQLEQQGDKHIHALNLRLKALEFLYMVSTDCVRFCDQATRAARNYQSFAKSDPCPHMDNFYNKLSILILEITSVKSKHISVSVAPKLFNASFNFLVSWVNYLQQRCLTVQAEKSIMKFKATILTYCSKILPKNCKLVAIASFSAGILLISTHLCQLTSGIITPSSSDLNALLQQCHFQDQMDEEFRSICETCCSLFYSQLRSFLKRMQINTELVAIASSHLLEFNSVVGCIAAIRNPSPSESTTAMNCIYTVGNLSYCCSFYQVLLSMCGIALDHFDKTNSQFSATIQAALAIARQFSQLIKDSHHSYGGHYVANVWPVASKCFSKGFFSEALQFYKTCCKFIKKSVRAEDSEATWNLNFQYIKFITVCFCNVKDYLSALNLLADVMSANHKHSKKLLELWVKVKRDAKESSPTEKLLTTTVKLVLAFAPKFKRKDLVSLLMQEFEAYKNYDAKEEKLAVMKDLLREEKEMDDCQKAMVLIDYAELQLIADVDPKRSPRACCNEAINLLENMNLRQNQKAFPSEKDCWLAHAFFVLHLFETRENQAASEAEVVNQNNAVAAAAAAAASSKRKSEEAGSNYNIPPAYLHITMEVEFNFVFYLDKSLDTWTAIVYTKSKNITNPVTAINDLKTMAEMYALVRMVSREVQAWKLVIEVAKAFSNTVEWGNAVARLVSLFSRNGLTNEASSVLKEFKPMVEELECKSESQPNYKHSQIVLTCLLLAESELLLMKNKVLEGFEYLQTVRNNLSSSKASVFTTLMQCEVNLLLSKFYELPSCIITLASDTDDSPIVLATRSLTTCLDLVKSIINRKDFKLYRCMELKPRLINLLMECTLRVGYLFQDIGAPRESSCFLKEQLLWAQKLSLANRSAELLLALGKLDIISGRYHDCQIKLHGVQFILESPGKQLQIKPKEFSGFQDDKTSSENIAEDYTDFASPVLLRKCLAQQSEDSVTCSPVMKNRTIFLNWQQHSSACLCIKCKQVVFHRLRLELAFAETECHFYALNHDANKAMESMSTILSYAETWRKTEQSLILEMTSNSSFKTCKGSKKASAERPILQLDIISCNALCKLAQMRMHVKDFTGAHLAIKSAYAKVCRLVHNGLAQTHYLLANIIYFYCLVKLSSFAARKGLSAMQFLNQTLWSSSEDASSESTTMEEIDFLTANIDNIHITGTTELVDCFKTPRNLSASVPKRSGRIRDAPMKKVSTLSVFENQFSDSDVQVFSPVKSSKCQTSAPKRKQAVDHEVNYDDKLNAMVDLTTPERCIMPKTAFSSKHISIANQENSDVEIRSPLKKTPNSRPVLGSFINGNFESMGKGGLTEKQVLTLRNSSSPETTGSSFISATKIRKAPKASRTRNNFGSTSSTASAQTETVRRSLRSRARVHSEPVLSSPIAAEVARCSDFDDIPAFTSEMLLPALSVDPVKVTSEAIDCLSKKCSGEKNAREAVHLLITDLETLRGSSPNTPAVQKMSKCKTKPSLKKKALTTERNNDAEFSVGKVIVLLEKAISLTCHHPHLPLYSDLNLLLTMCKGEKDESKAYNLFESMALTLRHQANYIFAAKLSKLSKECDRVSDNPNVDKSRLQKRKALLGFSRNVGDWNSSVEFISNKINKGWTVCQINVVSLQDQSCHKNRNPELIITRLRHNCKPLIAKTLPKASLDGVSNFSTEFESIAQESASGARLTDRNMWWSKRRDVDNRLKALVTSMEDYWLGHLKGLLLGSPAHEDDCQKLEEITRCLAKEVKSKGFEKFDENLLEAIVNSFSFMSDSLSRRALASMLCSSSNDKRITELWRIFKKKCACLCSEIIQRHHVILILDKELQMFPWENIPILCNGSVSRMPSIHFLLGHIALYGDLNSSTFPLPVMTVDTANAYYVLNPGNDLPGTEKQLSSTFKSLNWNGVTGRPPTSEEWSSALSDCDLFLYNGHGSGNQYVSLNTIQKSACRACVFLIGCSSAKLKAQGRKLEMDGVALHYLLAGSPFVMGNLWDVTDKAIDKFLEDLLKYWLPGSGLKYPSLCQAIISARANCGLLFAIGAAPVMYGIPIQAKKRLRPPGKYRASSPVIIAVITLKELKYFVGSPSWLSRNQVVIYFSSDQYAIRFLALI